MGGAYLRVNIEFQRKVGSFGLFHIFHIFKGKNHDMFKNDWKVGRLGKKNSGYGRKMVGRWEGGIKNQDML